MNSLTYVLLFALVMIVMASIFSYIFYRTHCQPNYLPEFQIFCTDYDNTEGVYK